MNKELYLAIVGELRELRHDVSDLKALILEMRRPAEIAGDSGLTITGHLELIEVNEEEP